MSKKRETEQDRLIGIDEHKYVFETINMWINNADSKVSTFCALFSIAYAAIAFVAESMLEKRILFAIKINFCLKNRAIGFIIAGGVFFFLAIFFLFYAISPRLIGTKAKKDMPFKYSIFYGNIARTSGLEEYRNAALNATKQDFETDLLNEIVYNATICAKKMLVFRCGIWISFAALLFESIGCVLLFFAYSK